MKKRISLIGFLLLFLLGMNVRADEGMWVPMLIGKNYQEMKKQGFKLKPEDLYSINKASLKDAIVSFGGFCTGELVSANGLLFTNHHCGYEAITSNSTPENNILDNGFYASSYAEEKPIPGLFVNFLVRMEDVTAKVNAAIKDLSGQDKQVALDKISEEISNAATEGTGYTAYVRDFYKGNQYFLYIFEKYTDVRLVGNPPQSIGKFGGDTDNWEWPRHTGDFSIFRVYAGKDNKPADYSADNVPYKPKKYLPVSIKGIENGDFTMVYGFPGRTDRYLTSFGVALATDSVSPEIVKLRDIRLTSWKEQMDKSVDYRLKKSSEYAQIANYWKYFIGQTEQLKKLKIHEQKQEEEQKFTAWAASKPEYAGLMAKYEDLYKDYAPYAIHRTFINEGFMASEWVQLAMQADAMYGALNASRNDSARLSMINSKINEMIEEYAKGYHAEADKKIFAQLLTTFYHDIPKYQHPKFITLIVEDYWKGSPEATFANFADEVWEKSALVDPARLRTFWTNPDMEKLEKDPGYQYAKNLVPSLYVQQNLGSVISDFEKRKAELDELYLKALLEMKKGELMYPDANSTMRISYGNVQNYSPKDGILYQISTDIDGAVQKYVPGDDEFDLPAKYLEAYKAKNYGQYAANGTLPVNFITNNDITGGNSGSPVINGKGELIGLAFDGNWEAMSGDIAFDEKYKRTICVDARYVLWCIDVLGGAKNIIAELDIKK